MEANLTLDVTHAPAIHLLEGGFGRHYEAVFWRVAASPHVNALLVSARLSDLERYDGCSATSEAVYSTIQLSDIISDMKQISEIPSASRSVGRPSSYRASFCQRVIELMAEGRSLDGCGAILGVHPDSLYAWQKLHPEFSDAVKTGRAAATAFWESRLLDVAKGGSGNAQAIQWALRNRSRAASGWDHAHAKVELSGPNGGAMQMATDLAVIDARLLTLDQRHALKQTLLAMKEQSERVS